MAIQLEYRPLGVPVGMSESLTALLVALLRPRLADTAWAWLEGALERARGGDVQALLQAYAAASLRVGRELLGPGEPDRARLRSVAPELIPDRWTLDDTARAALLLTRAGGQDAAFLADAIACYEQGDAREQQSWLRAVDLLPEARRFLPHVIDACRTNILPLFESVACENPYPARYFHDAQFNQLVLKALFTGVALARIVGLAARLNPELTRMAGDYAAERRAAGRPVPPDISLAMLETRFA